MSTTIIEFEAEFFAEPEQRCGIIHTAPAEPPSQARRFAASQLGGALLTITFSVVPYVFSDAAVVAEVPTLSSAFTVSGAVERSPDVCGGSARVANTRIPVWALVESRSLGKSDEQLLADFPSLQFADLQAAWAYYKRHAGEIDREISAQQAEV